MDELLPWLAAIGWGLLHGLSPASGWVLAADRGLQAGGSTRAWQALGPMAVGHVASAALVALLVLGGGAGWALDRALAQRAAGALLVGMALLRWRRGGLSCLPGHPRLGSTGLAAWSALMATANGAGLMLVPALAPVCLAGGAARDLSAPGSLLLAAAALVVHLGAMLLGAGAVAAVACRGMACRPATAGGGWPRRLCTGALGAAGLWLLFTAA